MPVKPTEREEEFFARQEFERRKAALLAREAGLAQEERALAQRMARGRCPRCGEVLVQITFRGVEVDKCAACQGLWLDVGELEQVVAGEQGFLSGIRRVFG